MSLWLFQNKKLKEKIEEQGISRCTDVEVSPRLILNCKKRCRKVGTICCSLCKTKRYIYGPKW